ncbi:MAG: hypothetical protein ACK5MH_00480 [Bacteroidales bacterium]
MNEIYWITRLDAVTTFLMVLIILAGITALACVVTYFSEIEYEDEAWAKKMFRTIKVSILVLVASSVLRVFVPTTNEMYAIIGIGGTYEYLKDNKDIKEIPDNTIKALKIWSENLLSEEEAKEEEIKSNVNQKTIDK